MAPTPTMAYSDSFRQPRQSVSQVVRPRGQFSENRVVCLLAVCSCFAGEADMPFCGFFNGLVVECFFRPTLKA